MNKSKLKQMLKRSRLSSFMRSKRQSSRSRSMIRELERVILLKVIDRKWMDHIDDMEQLRQGIGLQAYGQRDPLVEYKMNGYEMFDAMTASIQEDTIRLLYHVRVEQKVEREEVAKVTGTNKDEYRPEGAEEAQEDQRYIPTIPAPAEAARSINSAAADAHKKMITRQIT